MKIIPRVLAVASLVLMMTGCSKKASCPVCGLGIESIKLVPYGKSDVPVNFARCKGDVGESHQFVVTIVSDLTPLVDKEKE